MANNGESYDLPPTSTNNADAQNREYLAQQLAEHARLKKLLPFLRCNDILDANIRQVVNNILTIEPKLGEDAFQMEDISDMVDSTCQLDEILSPSFFGRTPFPFRMLRLALELHLIDPIDNSKFLNVRMTDNEKRNQGLKQLIWFLLFLGATPDEISENLALYRQSRQDARASFSHGASSSRARTDNLRNIDETRTSITNLRNVSENIQFPGFEPQAMQPDARISHGNPSAPRPLMREQTTAQAQAAAQSSRTDDEQSHSKKGFAVHSLDTQVNQSTIFFVITAFALPNSASMRDSCRYSS